MSEQISTAGTEASGTGNMKFALNGALTIGTLDGANVEIRHNVGEDNIFIFGHTTEQVADIRMRGYQPRSHYEVDPQLAAAVDAIGDGTFCAEEPERYQSIYDALVNWGDHYLLLADYASYVATQDQVHQLYRDPDAWTCKAIHNVAGMGPFTSDRTIAPYAHEIWHTAGEAAGRHAPVLALVARQRRRRSPRRQIALRSETAPKGRGVPLCAP